jgi:membrane protein YdbS with pleckstrin-like domain
MQTQYITPNSRYLGKLFLIVTLIAIGVLIAGALLGWLISLDEGEHVGRTVSFVIFLVDAAFWLTAIILIGPFYRSLKYEIQDDEVIVRVGIWTKSVKHVPYRTVTNIKINRGILDRFVFNIGTLNIQTAGMSGNTGAEESLVGMANVQEIYEAVAAKLRKFRGGMTPTGAGVDFDTSYASGETLGQLLEEVKSIRKSLEK